MNRLVAEKVSEILKTNASLPKSNNNSEKYKEKTELLPLFDPENSCVTALNWLRKIEQIAGLAKVWYNGLDNYDITWDEWKLALIRAFPSHTDFVDLLKQMLGRHKQQDESMMHYFYSKNMLVGRCGLTDTKAVSCIIDGLPADLQANAKAGNYQTPDDLFYNFLSKQDKGKNPLESKSRNDYARNQYQGTSGQFRCHICKKLGHKARHCHQSGQFRGNNGSQPRRDHRSPGTSLLKEQPHWGTWIPCLPPPSQQRTARSKRRKKKEYAEFGDEDVNCQEGRML
ncbi:hypothetical protein NQ315_014627 [Exocentrus adspersus]|uniref:CCHC-type domain-containing protein n=1 Tax=Exocentrus adspersus TaxID=1586481 RepID=A0AAV8VR21_9CUCU|nr:hypothetical protein NQ315_014627 [Exocentrus adspersus]